MLRKFKHFEDFDFEGFERVIEGMEEIIHALNAGAIPVPKRYPKGMLRTFCRSLVEGQRNDIEGILPYSWAVVPTAEGMPSDARVDLVFFPTYLAVAILTRVLVDFPEIADEIPGYREALHNGMIFSTHRGLDGHGYEAVAQMMEAVGIMVKGKVPQYLKDNPEACPGLLRTLQHIKGDAEERLRTGNTTGGWNSDYAPGYKIICEQLELL